MPLFIIFEQPTQGLSRDVGSFSRKRRLVDKSAEYKVTWAMPVILGRSARVCAERELAINMNPRRKKQQIPRFARDDNVGRDTGLSVENGAVAKKGRFRKLPRHDAIDCGLGIGGSARF